MHQTPTRSAPPAIVHVWQFHHSHEIARHRLALTGGNVCVLLRDTTECVMVTPGLTVRAVMGEQCRDLLAHETVSMPREVGARLLALGFSDEGRGQSRLAIPPKTKR